MSKSVSIYFIIFIYRSAIGIGQSCGIVSEVKKWYRDIPILNYIKSYKMVQNQTGKSDDSESDGGKSDGSEPNTNICMQPIH